jgi:hypothetical protein
MKVPAKLINKEIRLGAAQPPRSADWQSAVTQVGNLHPSSIRQSSVNSDDKLTLP